LGACSPETIEIWGLKMKFPAFWRILHQVRIICINGTVVFVIYCNLKLQDPTEKHFGDVGILDKYEDNNNNNNDRSLRILIADIC
jgi:hypothetical protein